MVRSSARAITLCEALLGIADSLVLSNHHFRALASGWASQGNDARHSRVKVASRFCRIAFQMLAGRQVFRHPCIQGRHCILDKLSAFHTEYGTPLTDVLRHLEAALAQIPRRNHAEEAKPLKEELQRIQEGHRRGPQPLATILPAVLARLGVGVVQSEASGE